MSQTDFPRESLQKALRIANAIWENFAGRGAAPHEIAMALDVSPTSGSWRDLCGAAIAYGVTEGGCNATEIRLSDLGRRIVAPTQEGGEVAARVEAAMKPKLMCEFFSKYNRAKFPKENIAENVLIQIGLPKDRASRAVQLIIENGNFVGILRQTKTGLFVAVDTPAPVQTFNSADDDNDGRDQPDETVTPDAKNPPNEGAQRERPQECAVAEMNNKVFISHGKNKNIVNQLKELLTFGNFTAVVSVEKDSASIPVPEKVFQDMRACSAAVIHVGKEGEVLDREGNTRITLNENVLIEIGAAIALYGKRFLLLVEKDVKLPSNLQGLYRCEYEGDKLDYEATMKLLKTFNDFR
jgi:predicted nucleotide-binding protein